MHVLSIIQVNRIHALRTASICSRRYLQIFHLFDLDRHDDDCAAAVDAVKPSQTLPGEQAFRRGGI